MKFEGDLAVVGETGEELGGPMPSPTSASRAAWSHPSIWRRQGALREDDRHRQRAIASAFPVAHGGCSSPLQRSLSPDRTWISPYPAGCARTLPLLRSPGRFVITVARVTGKRSRSLRRRCAPPRRRRHGLRVSAGETLIEQPIRAMKTAYKAPFGGY